MQSESVIIRVELWSMNPKKVRRWYWLILGMMFGVVAILAVVAGLIHAAKAERQRAMVKSRGPHACQKPPNPPQSRLTVSPNGSKTVLVGVTGVRLNR